MKEIKQAIKALSEIQEKYDSFPYNQRYELLELKQKLEKTLSDINELQEEVEANIDQKETHCQRCASEFCEVVEESNENEGLCCYCAQIGDE